MGMLVNRHTPPWLMLFRAVSCCLSLLRLLTVQHGLTLLHAYAAGAALHAIVVPNADPNTPKFQWINDAKEVRTFLCKYLCFVLIGHQLQGQSYDMRVWPKIHCIIVDGPLAFYIYHHHLQSHSRRTYVTTPQPSHNHPAAAPCPPTTALQLLENRHAKSSQPPHNRLAGRA